MAGVVKRDIRILKVLIDGGDMPAAQSKNVFDVSGNQGFGRKLTAGNKGHG
jgi:hypothetical protein